MSEITTGVVEIPAAVVATAGRSCVQAVSHIKQHCAEKYDQMISEIEQAEERLQWIDKKTCSSPRCIAEEAKKLKQRVSINPLFQQVTKGLNSAQKEIMAGAIATEKSPLRGYLPSLIEKLPEKQGSFDKALEESSRKMAADNFSFVNRVVAEAAKATGFIEKTNILKQTDSVMDVVFTDRQGRKFTTYCKLNKKMNPSLALDLEGFECNSSECSLKMEEIIRYLKEHGVPFGYKRFRHNQPQGVLRKKLNQKKEAEDEHSDAIISYLKGDNRNPAVKNKNKKKRNYD